MILKLAGSQMIAILLKLLGKILKTQTALTVFSLSPPPHGLTGIPENQIKVIKGMIDSWYQYRAKVIFQERLHAMLPRATKEKGIPSFRIMTMKKQWGSCSKQGQLMLNPHLVKASKECIDYVILHELCHIAEHNHSEKFWRLLTQVMPNWKEVKAKLDDMAELYLNE